MHVKRRGLAGGVQRVARRVQAALPIVGLFSRLTATSGGVGSDALSYPEYCRKLIDAAPAGFDQAVAEFERRYGKVPPKRFHCQKAPCLHGLAKTPVQARQRGQVDIPA